MLVIKLGLRKRQMEVSDKTANLPNTKSVLNFQTLIQQTILLPTPFQFLVYLILWADIARITSANMKNKTVRVLARRLLKQFRRMLIKREVGFWLFFYRRISSLIMFREGNIFVLSNASEILNKDTVLASILYSISILKKFSRCHVVAHNELGNRFSGCFFNKYFAGVPKIP